MKSDWQSALQRYFGYPDFRGEQLGIIEHLWARESALVLMPTGVGKSLCYQLPALESRGLTLVLSPLVALMNDQVGALRRRGMPAACLHAQMRAEERAAVLRQVEAGKLRLLYVTPERFRKDEFRHVIAKASLEFLAVDEAHCISAWGHDFRPDYSRLGDIRAALGDPPTLALTATATPRVQADILRELRLEGARVFDAGLQRDNLELSVIETYDLEAKVRAILMLRHQQHGPTIIYISLIQSLHKLATELRKLGLQPWLYHGQLPAAARAQAQKDFLQSRDGVLLATPAFGLGIDKPDVRMVVHAEIPGSLEAYYQEVGRAGRDGLPAQGVLLFSEDDISIQMDFIKWTHPEPAFVQNVYDLIAGNLTRARQEGFEYLRQQMNFYNSRDFRVETAVNWLERWGSLQGLQPRDWQPLEPPPPEYMDATKMAEHLRSAQQRLLATVQLAQMHDGCRLQTVYQYFGVRDAPVCGRCDLCRGTRVS